MDVICGTWWVGEDDGSIAIRLVACHPNEPISKETEKKGGGVSIAQFQSSGVTNVRDFGKRIIHLWR